jgi:hypothetical protein
MEHNRVALFGSDGLICDLLLLLLLLIFLSKVFEVVHMVPTDRIFAGKCQS